MALPCARVLGKSSVAAPKRQAQFAALAGEATYFGFLAADWLDRPYEICPCDWRATPPPSRFCWSPRPNWRAPSSGRRWRACPSARRAWDFAVAGLGPSGAAAWPPTWPTAAAGTTARCSPLNKGEGCACTSSASAGARETDPPRLRRRWHRPGLGLRHHPRRERLGGGRAPGANTYGLMQLLPGTAAQLAKAEKIPYRRAEDLIPPRHEHRPGTPTSRAWRNATPAPPGWPAPPNAGRHLWSAGCHAQRTGTGFLRRHHPLPRNAASTWSACWRSA